MIVSRQRPRRGLTVVAVLICLIIVTMIGGAVLKAGLTEREVASASEERLQAEWLAESGADRALSRLDTDVDYKGETWSLSRAELGLGTPARAGDESSAAAILIVVDRPAGSPASRHIRVQADYRPNPARHVRHTKQMLINLDNH
jgi:Tfp pilus assembly protein PilV